MASIGPIEVGIKITDPNWQLLCVALTSHSMRALAYLEAARPDLALGALREAAAAGDLAMMCHCELSPKETITLPQSVPMTKRKPTRF